MIVRLVRPLHRADQLVQRIQQARRRRHLVCVNQSHPLACFAGIWTNWTSVRKVEEGETTNDIFAFLTTEPNAEVGAIHPKAMPVILTTPDEVETWMTAPPDEALKLQRPIADGALQIVARGVKEDAQLAPSDKLASSPSR